MLFEVRQHLVIESVSSGYRRFGGIQFGEGHLAVSIDEGLLIDTTNTFQVSHIKRILRA